jgi:N-acetylated-alpha-linked acidic dipeptidase
MRFQSKAAAALLALSASLAAPDALPREGSPEPTKWEGTLREVPDAGRIREANRSLSAEPHHLGSPYGARNARWILERFREYGLDASIETFYVLFPTPKQRVLELLEPVRFRAALAEPPVPGDPTSAQTGLQLPTYNAYSIDGDVTAPLVYVNYGVPADYERLESLGIDVKGKIVIARYGASWRGIKPKVAAEHGAVGCVIYSDPREDGYFAGDAYPKGALRPDQGVQRGSVKDMPTYSGDPLTPGVGATKKPERFDLKDAHTLTKIPVLPISYSDARPLLAALSGPVAPAEWRGALPLTYHVGPGPARVRLKVSFDWKIVAANDVIARIEGSTWPDEWVIHGNHHDAWVNGSTDPVSGMSPLLEEARAFGELLRKGWRPKRTILLCAWDGEEEGLLGSTEWAETHAEELSRKAVVYINSDSNGRGFLSAGGSHTLEPFVNDVASGITDPEKKIPVGERLRLKRIADAKTPEERREIRDQKNFRIEALGSGSDFTPFLQHLGIASLNLGYGGEDEGGVYHSIYDDFSWYTRFADTDFAYGRALSQTIGTALLRLADADLLPLDPGALADTVARYVKEVQDLAKEKREAAEELARQIDEGVPAAVADPKEPFVAPKKEAAPPYFDFSPLENASTALVRAAKDYRSALATADAAAKIDPARVARVNTSLREIERSLTREEGLPGRPWYRHYVYAPGFYTGYAVKTLPAVREAIEQKQWGNVNREIAATARVLEKAAEKVTEAASALRAP